MHAYNARRIGDERAFTLIELLVVIAIIVVLAAILLPVIGAVRGQADEARTRQLVNDLGTHLDLFSLDERSLPAPDHDCHIAYDPSIDVQDAQDLKSFATWPVLNKLLSKQQFSVDMSHDVKVQDDGSRLLVDAWQQPIRYVIGPGVDDHGHQPQGMFTDWNSDPDQAGSPQRSAFPYVWSYGRNNPSGDETALWIRNGVDG